MNKFRVVYETNDIETAREMIGDMKNSWFGHIEEYVESVSKGRWLRID